MADRFIFIFQLWLAFIAIGFVHMLLCWRTLQSRGIGTPVFKVFYGGPVSQFVWRGTSFQLGWIPLGIFVKWDEDQYPRAPWWLRVGIPLLGPCVAGLAAYPLLGGELWHAQMARSFGQI